MRLSSESAKQVPGSLPPAEHQTECWGFVQMQSLCSEELAGQDKGASSLRRAIRTVRKRVWGVRGGVYRSICPQGPSAPDGGKAKAKPDIPKVTLTATLDHAYYAPATALSP